VEIVRLLLDKGANIKAVDKVIWREMCLMLFDLFTQVSLLTLFACYIFFPIVFVIMHNIK